MPPRGAVPFTTRHVYTEQWQVLLHSKPNQSVKAALDGELQVFQGQLVLRACGVEINANTTSDGQALRCASDG